GAVVGKAEVEDREDGGHRRHEQTERDEGRTAPEPEQREDPGGDEGERDRPTAVSWGLLFRHEVVSEPVRELYSLRDGFRRRLRCAARAGIQDRHLLAGVLRRVS